MPSRNPREVSDLYRTAITIRLPKATADQLREEHARTFAAHRLNWNNWLLSRIQLSFTTGV